MGRKRPYKREHKYVFPGQEKGGNVQREAMEPRRSCRTVGNIGFNIGRLRAWQYEGYCMRECPVHGFLPLATEEKSLEGIALRLLQNFNEDSLKNMRDSLIEITADGKITKDELPALEKIIGQLEKMAEVISEMKIAGEKYLNGK